FILLFSLFLIFSFSQDAFAQQYSEQSFNKVDSLANQAKPKAALALINDIYNYSNTHKNATLAVKAAIYRMLFQSYLEEDAIDTIVKNLRIDIEKAQQPQKSILQSILANTYWSYYQQNQYKISQRTDIAGNVNNDIKTWSIPQLNREISRVFFLSLKEQQLLQKTKIDAISMLLEGDDENTVYRPTLYDLLAHRAIEVFTSSRYNMVSIPEDNSILNNLLVNDEEFVKYQIPSDSTSFTLQAIKVFQELTKFHQSQNNLKALADVELKRLKFIRERSVEKQPLKFYNALSQLALKVKETDIYTEVLYEQALLHKNKLLPIDTNNLNLLAAVKIAETAAKAYPKSIGAKNASNLIRQIKSKELTFQVKYQGIPDRAIPLHFSYKNVDTVTFSIYKIGFTENPSRYYRNESEYRKFISNKKPFKTWQIVLPNHGDYQQHTFIDKIDGLPAGSYIITALDNENASGVALGREVELEVSNIITHFRVKGTYLEYKVVNAANGSPLKSARVQEAKYISTFSADFKKTYTDQNGFAITSRHDDYNYALITHQNDSLLVAIDNYYRDEDEDDRKAILFTDRPIYRPGQTVYYKGILLGIKKAKNEILPNEKLYIGFKDTNRKEFGSQDVTTNEFGSFQGSFIIPNGKLNGTMWIETAYGGVNVQVEEYKRPTFELVFDKSDQKYKLDDSVKVNGKAVAFAGYAIGDAKLTYKVMRRIMPRYNSYRYMPVQVKQVASGNSVTSADGNFNISFRAEADEPASN
ncbi:MAG: hypothetical protein EOO07_17475, partial [Chitinophagaceae bacterium]